tara:strand:+ start:1593 stop:2429 length:837 start_codon:yes stop_codon:yes gene_type:complete
MNKIKLTPNYPVYPPYHKGEYLEDYYMTFSDSNTINTDRIYIPVSWTTYYCDGYNRNELQSFLNNLDPSLKYYTVCQHDDAPQENLPEDTLIFSAGGNCEKSGVIPIPLVCSPLPSELIVERERTILLSFVGSVTHPIRQKCIESLRDESDVELAFSNWSNRVPEDNFKYFINKTLSSKFCLAPRGYGASSFRMYEAMQLGSIPVYVTDKVYTPFTDVLDWNDFAVIIKEKDISSIHEILLSYDEDRIVMMQKNLKEVWNKYFSIDAVCHNIKRILEL